MKTVEQLLTRLTRHPEIASRGLNLSIVLDDAPNTPIVLQVVSQEDVDNAKEAACEGDPPYLWKAGDVRYEVSDGLPGERNESLDFVNFFDAVDKALETKDEQDDDAEEQRRDEKRGLYPQHEDPAN